MITSFRHTGIVVRDLEKSLVFYKDILGLMEWKRFEESGSYIDTVVGLTDVVIEWVKLRVPNGPLIELLQYKSHPSNEVENNFLPINRIGCSHVAFTVQDVDYAYKYLLEKGYSSINAPAQSPDGYVKVMYCYDPDGSIIELVQEIQSN